MDDWVRRCWLSPLAVVLGMLWKGPSTLEEVEALLARLYDGSPRCWDSRVARGVVAVLKEYGLVREEGGVLRLEREKLHPVTREIAEGASGLL